VRFSSLLVLGGVLLFTLAAAAGAAFPGENGRIVFVSDRDGNREIYSMRADGSDPLRLTVNEVTDVRPAWSPDGRLIAFARERNGIPQLWVMKAGGSDQRQAASPPPGFGDSEPAWSPDGKFLTFTRRAAPAGPEEPPAPGDVYTMRADGRHVRNLTDSPEQDDFEPTWSPDGKRIAFDSDRGDAGGVDVWDMDVRNGRKQRRLTDVPGFDGGPNYSPDGRRLVFDSERTGGGDVYVMTAAGTSPLRLTESDASDIVTAWSPDGAMIAFSSNRDAPTAEPARYEVYVMRADGSDDRNLSRNLASDDDDPDWQPLHKNADEVDASVITNAGNGNLLSVPRVGSPAGEGGARAAQASIASAIAAWGE
jgi:Tol biopolymer transport system component